MAEADAARRKTTGLILAGGEGRRMGGRDKGLVEWRGEPLVTYVAARFEPQVNTLLISCNRNSKRYAALAAATISDGQPGYEGPLAGILAAAPRIQTPYLALAPCDTPELPEDMVARLASELLRSGSEIAYAKAGDQAHYLCALLDCRVLTSLATYFRGGGRAVRHWYAKHDAIAVDFTHAVDAFLNLNELE